MEPLIIEKHGYAPSVVLSPSDNRFEITGKSIPENADGFYHPIIDWLQEYATDPNPKTNFLFKFEYFSSASSKEIISILQILDKMKAEGNDVLITWCYQKEEEDIKQAGEEFEGILNLDFEFKEYEE